MVFSLMLSNYIIIFRDESSNAFLNIFGIFHMDFTMVALGIQE